MIEEVYPRWEKTIRLAYVAAKTERKLELEGTPLRKYDAAGLHHWSLLVGEVYTYQDLCPEIRELGFNHLDLWRIARADAEEEFRQDILHEHVTNLQNGGAVATQSEENRSADVA